MNQGSTGCSAHPCHPAHPASAQQQSLAWPEGKHTSQAALQSLLGAWRSPPALLHQGWAPAWSCQRCPQWALAPLPRCGCQSGPTPAPGCASAHPPLPATPAVQCRCQRRRCLGAPDCSASLRCPSSGDAPRQARCREPRSQAGLAHSARLGSAGVALPPCGSIVQRHRDVDDHGIAALLQLLKRSAAPAAYGCTRGCHMGSVTWPCSELTLAALQARRLAQHQLCRLQSCSHTVRGVMK